MIILTTGKQDRGARATLAFAWACAALALGKETSIFLTMDGAIWAMEHSVDGVQVAGFEPLTNHVETFFALGGKMLLCAPCSEYYCGMGLPQRAPALWPEAVITGLTSVVSAANSGCQLVTF